MKSFSIAFCLALIAVNPANAQTPDQRDAAITLRKVIAFHRVQVGHQGAYLWTYSADLQKQEGEGKATQTSGWTQPPGTPTVGSAYLNAWRLSGEQTCLDAAVDSGHALVRAQLRSGGWASHFDLGPAGAKRYAYRSAKVSGRDRRRNLTTFDDNKSQSAMIFLMRLDEELRFKDARIHQTVEYALEHMLAAQYPNGAWPQQFDQPANPADYPVKQASYPKTWSRVYPKKKYTGYYTLNDNNMSHIIDMLFEAHRIYGRNDCYQAALKTGDFFLLAQMPEPQPGWAQQYNLEMHPAWARKFEPPSITGGESQSVMKSLISLYRQTGEQRFLNPIPKALNYYRRSLLQNGQLARFYELRANKPLYFTKDYQLTYSDAGMPTHYSFKVGSKLAAIERARQKALRMKPGEFKTSYTPPAPFKLRSSLTKQAKKIMSQLDARGAWVEKGNLRYHGSDDDTDRIISMQTYSKNLEALAAFVGAK
ncbi:MAG: pectate lyase [Verrucomicrobiia bacterium]